MTKQEKKGLKINLTIDQSNFYPLHTHVHFHHDLYMDIDISKKQEVKTFFDLFTSLYLPKYFSEYSNGPFKDEPDSISLMFRDKIHLNNKQRGRVFTRLHGMVKQAEAYFKYLDYYRFNFNQKGVEYYLRLRSLGKYINKDTLLKRSIITLDVNYLKIYSNFFNRKKAREDADNLNKKLTKFQETMSEIYLDAVAYLKTTKEKNVGSQKEQSSNTNVKVFKPGEMITINVDTVVTYVGEYDDKRKNTGIVNHRYPSFNLYMHKVNNANMDYVTIVDKLKSQLNDFTLNGFNDLLKEYLGPLSKLYNFNDNVSCEAVANWCVNRGSHEHYSVKLSINVKYCYKRNLDILVREDDEIKSKLQRFIEYITKFSLINLDKLEFNL